MSIEDTEEWEIELRRQKEEVEEEVGPIIKLNNEGKLSYDEYLEKLIQALKRAKEKYCKRHGFTKEEYDEERYEER